MNRGIGPVYIIQRLTEYNIPYNLLYFHFTHLLLSCFRFLEKSYEKIFQVAFIINCGHGDISCEIDRLTCSVGFAQQLKMRVEGDK